MKRALKRQVSALPRQSQSAKEAIITAALKAFARDGFDGASFAKIAEMAGVGHPLIHYHFGTKDNLWRETVDYSLGDLRREVDTIRTASRALSPLDQLRVLLRAFNHFAARFPDHFGMFIAEARSESERYHWLQENYTGPLFEDLKSLLRKAKEAGQIKDVDIDQVAFILMGGILLYFTVNPTLPKNRDLNQLADEHTELMFAMLLDGLGSKRPPRAQG